MRLKKKHHLGQELAEVTHGEKEIRRICRYCLRNAFFVEP
jgi:hypothetical protein